MLIKQRPRHVRKSLLMCDDGIRVRGRGVNRMTKHVAANWLNHTFVPSVIIVKPFHSIASIVASLDCSATGYRLEKLIGRRVENTTHRSWSQQLS